MRACEEIAPPLIKQNKIWKRRGFLKMAHWHRTPPRAR
jgi:hypothetical protein